MCIYIRAISQEMPQPAITKIRLKMKYLKFHSNFPAANGLNTFYQIRRIAGCAYAGNAGGVFPATDFKGNRWLAIPACITAGKTFQAHAQPTVLRIWQEAQVTYVPAFFSVTSRAQFPGVSEVTMKDMDKNDRYQAKTNSKQCLHLDGTQYMFPNYVLKTPSLHLKYKYGCLTSAWE